MKMMEGNLMPEADPPPLPSVVMFKTDLAESQFIVTSAAAALYEINKLRRQNPAFAKLLKLAPIPRGFTYPMLVRNTKDLAERMLDQLGDYF